MRKSNPIATETQALTLMTHSSSQLLDIELHLEEADYEQRGKKWASVYMHHGYIGIRVTCTLCIRVNSQVLS